MKKTTTEIIAREGWVELGIIFALFMGTLSLEISLLSFILFIIFAIRIYYYLNTEKIPEDRDEFALLAPVDGEIIQVSSTKDSTQVVIKNSFFDSHIIRSPLEGEFVYGGEKHGLNFKDFERADMLNSKKSFSIDNVKVEIIYHHDTYQNSLYFSDKQRVFRGERVGFLNRGYCKISLPPKRVKIALGDKVEAGKSTIAFLN
ncbi:MAG: phosphatidylserine decarboxylase [Campylobacterales bacterium]